ncbi:putative outer membrane starch-binding protein [Dysgonomonas alginatilytica]|uniref:Putative outer membrane starch-binding protein n=1 Tax=Dysgonomonas alginatilytica TaxID=1605892 RepID=A0A2V3PRN5_9BACT|nr:RagB/SusD family nutrient uptake outer membrane protein [Dysgonomonas alginatilytica]PXV65472.1 putative outer membrane starch-binding protein [Dysgonomonas alginatilytica]
MKKILIFGLTSLLMLSSCTESFLESTPTTQIPAEQFYNSEERITQGLIAAYAPLQWPDWAFGQYNPLQFVSDVMSDDVRVGGGNAKDNEHLQRMRFFNANSLLVCESLWTVFYSGINRANIVIHRIDDVPNLAPANKNRILAEAYTLRAYYYSWLWKLWGNVPHYDVNPSTPPFLVPQISADELYAKIIEDLNFALDGDKLPSTVVSGETGRFTKAAAQMLRANVVMYQNDEAKFPQVLQDMQSIIGAGSYDLNSSFGDIWEDKGEWSKESIFEVNYSDDLATRSWDNPLFAGGSVYPTLIGINGISNSPEFAGGWGFEPVEKALYDTYEAADQRKDGGILNFAKHKEEYPGANYDPRYDDTGYFNRKYLPRQGGNSKSTAPKELNYRNNYRVYRFSETLLIASELLVRTGGSQTQADEYLNKVRGRAYNNTGNYKKTATLDNLLIENRLEFALEGHRFWDLVRFGKAEQVLGSRGFTANKKHLPIPQSEIDKAQGTLTQNPY